MATSKIKVPMRIDYSSGVDVSAGVDVAITKNKVLIGNLLSNSNAFARVIVDSVEVAAGRGVASANTVFPVFLPLYAGQTLRLSPSDANATFQCKLYDVIGA